MPTALGEVHVRLASVLNLGVVQLEVNLTLLSGPASPVFPALGRAFHRKQSTRTKKGEQGFVGLASRFRIVIQSQQQLMLIAQ